MSSKVSSNNLLGATSGKWLNLPKFSTKVKLNLIKTSSKVNYRALSKSFGNLLANKGL